MKQGINTFMEQYQVSIDYQKPDGYWVCSHKEYIFVPVEFGVNEKNNHDKAAAMVKKLYPGCRINSVTYC
jgi:hypothetical protein